MTVPVIARNATTSPMVTPTTKWHQNRVRRACTIMARLPPQMTPAHVLTLFPRDSFPAPPSPVRPPAPDHHGQSSGAAPDGSQFRVSLWQARPFALVLRRPVALEH